MKAAKKLKQGKKGLFKGETVHLVIVTDSCTCQEAEGSGLLSESKNQLKIQRSKQGVNPKVVKGPLIDSCADIPVVPASFKSKLSNLLKAYIGSSC